ncbi:Rrf2 family transcriptional regulator [Bdellovibrio sp. 22V]|uniref:RrF2 family transcriptional regulator n=1 Tax=Bdellovibrio TaxID=958 RepID=UPI0025428C23|nr:Rrf2 family transcriptional regulator [Bdellovibrio sp. 22V]WII70814.1 Rrf2 family transcriptional regulator [Bdellovibrio sp. 22V]
MVDQRFSVSVHIMTVLAYHKDEMMTSEELASSIRTNPTVIRRLVSKLVDAGLVDSFKGKAGGVRLAGSAKEISLKDIYEAICDKKKLIATPCKEPMKQCAVSCNMGKLLEDVVEGMEEHSMNYLSSIRLADLASKIK